MVVKRFGTVYEILTALKVSKLFYFDLMKPCHVTDLPPWIKQARKKYQDQAVPRTSPGKTPD